MIMSFSVYNIKILWRDGMTNSLIQPAFNLILYSYYQVFGFAVDAVVSLRNRLLRKHA